MQAEYTSKALTSQDKTTRRHNTEGHVVRALSCFGRQHLEIKLFNGKFFVLKLKQY